MLKEEPTSLFRWLGQVLDQQLGNHTTNNAKRFRRELAERQSALQDNFISNILMLRKWKQDGVDQKVAMETMAACTHIVITRKVDDAEKFAKDFARGAAEFEDKAALQAFNLGYEVSAAVNGKWYIASRDNPRTIAINNEGIKKSWKDAYEDESYQFGTSLDALLALDHLEETGKVETVQNTASLEDAPFEDLTGRNFSHTDFPPEEFHEAAAINQLAKTVHEANKTWWTDPATGLPIKRNMGEMLMLVVSEIAEAMEGDRKGLFDDKIPTRKMLEVELVDALIRILDISAGTGLDLGGAFVEKMAFNKQREDHRPENRLKAGGKKY